MAEVCFHCAGGSIETPVDIVLTDTDLPEPEPIWGGVQWVERRLGESQLMLVASERPKVQRAVVQLYTGRPPRDPVVLNVYSSPSQAPALGERRPTLPADLAAHLEGPRPLWLDYHQSDVLEARRQVGELTAQRDMALHLWSSVEGLEPPLDGPTDTRELEAALRAILNTAPTRRTLFLFNYLPDDPYWLNTPTSPVGDLVIAVCQRVQEAPNLQFAVLAPTGEVPARWRGLFEVLLLGGRPLVELPRLARDLTALAQAGKLTRLQGRHKELKQIWQILNRAPGGTNSPLLVAPPGVGKSALVEGLAVEIAARRAPERFRNCHVFELGVGALLAGTSLRGQLEERVQNLLAEVRANRDTVILFIDEIHSLLDNNREGAQIAQQMKQVLARGDFPLIGATTDGEVAALLRDPAFANRFTVIRLAEPSVEETVEILKVRVPDLEKRHRLMIPEEVIREVVTLAARELPGRLPRKAVDLLRDIASGAELRGARRLTIEDVLRGVEQLIGIPLGALSREDQEMLEHLEAQLNQWVRFQPQAIRRFVTAIVARRLGQTRKEQRPLCFLFVGPSGVGKTSLAQALAESYLGSRSALLRYDMAQFTSRWEATRLFGSAPGYVGYDEGSLLVNDIRRQPRSVVLFDEIEKAHPTVVQSLMGLLDTGRIRDPRGWEGDFRHAIIVLTSNAVRDPDIADMKPAQLREAVTRAFQNLPRLVDGGPVPTEFIGRVDIVPFRLISQEELATIAGHMLDEMVRELKEGHHLQVQIEPDVPLGLVQFAGLPEQGVRPVREAIHMLRDDIITELALQLRRAGRIYLRINKATGEPTWHFT